MDSLDLGFSNRDERQFTVNFVTRIVKEAIEHTIGEKDYDSGCIEVWTAKIAEICLDALYREQKTYKHIVTVMIMEKNGCGLHNATSCVCCTETDGSYTVRWENQTNYVMVSVCASKI